MTILAMALVVFLTGYIFKPIESVLMAIGLSGWWLSGFIWGVLNFPGVIARYKARRFGAATLTILIGMFIRILMGSPMSNLLAFYALSWGLPADIIQAVFGQKRNLWVTILAWGVAGLVTFWLCDFIFFREVYMNFYQQFGFVAISGIHRVIGGIGGAVLGWAFAKGLERVGVMD
jgi:ABC-type thiamin/hydroxymethylpyrimidine transport system permease subunit